jgi:hypothetical protein
LDSIGVLFENFSFHLQVKSCSQLEKMISILLQFMTGLLRQNSAILLLIKLKFMMQPGVPMKTHSTLLEHTT